MAKTRLQKQEDVKILTEKLARAKSVVFADYQGLTMNQLSKLRNELREQNAEFNVTKNTLLEISMPTAYNLQPTTYQGPTATLFSYGDEIVPIKILVKALKEAQKGKIKGGILDAEALDGIVINRLASLPSKLELQAKVVGSLSSPLYGIVGVLQANLRNLVFALDQIRIQRG